MRKKSILKQLLIPMLTLAVALPAVVLVIFTTSYEREIYEKNKQLSGLMAGAKSPFLWIKPIRSAQSWRTIRVF